MNNSGDVLAKIQLLTKSAELTDLERSRLANELNTVHERLSKGDYQRFSYTTNTFDVPNRTRDFFTELEFYCLLGQTWAALLKEMGVNQFSRVADLCPGYTPKIELGLFYTGYTGEVVVLDTDEDSIGQLQQFMALFQPDFTITKKVVNLFADPLDSYDVVLGNHIIDDLVLYYYSQKRNIPLSELYAHEQTMIGLWHEIIENKEEYIPEITGLIANIFLKTVKKGGYLCLSQYPSYMERMLDMDEAPRFNKRVLAGVAEILTQQGFTPENHKAKKAFKTFKGHFGPDDCIILRREK